MAGIIKMPALKAGNLSAQVPGHTVNRSCNALARGQCLQACPEILVGGADDLVASEVADEGFLRAPPDDVDGLEAILLRQLQHQLPDAGGRCRLEEPVALLEMVSR